MEYKLMTRRGAMKVTKKYFYEVMSMYSTFNTIFKRDNRCLLTCEKDFKKDNSACTLYFETFNYDLCEIECLGMIIKSAKEFNYDIG